MEIVELRRRSSTCKSRRKKRQSSAHPSRRSPERRDDVVHHLRARDQDRSSETRNRVATAVAPRNDASRTHLIILPAFQGSKVSLVRKPRACSSGCRDAPSIGNFKPWLVPLDKTAAPNARPRRRRWPVHRSPPAFFRSRSTSYRRGWTMIAAGMFRRRPKGSSSRSSQRRESRRAKERRGSRHERGTVRPNRGVNAGDAGG